MERRAITRPANALLPGHGFDEEKLIAPRQAIVAYFSRAAIAPPQRECVALECAFGRVLAEDIAADDDYPNARRSAMDGYALRAAATPGTFALSAEVRMGRADGTPVAAGEAARIPTGGALPAGTDAVVPIEEAVDGDGVVSIGAAIEPGYNVIEPGQDMRRGEVMLHAGRRIGSPQLGVLATLGVTTVPVYRQPTVAVLSSGDEIVSPRERPLPGQVRDSNRYAVSASLEAMGARAMHYPTLRDDAGAFERGLRAALDECDALAITGGSSVGERDRLPGAVAALGEPGVVVHGLRLRPGKPTLLGNAGGKPILGLPGNPTSALMMLEAVVSPIVAALTGAQIVPDTVTARLAQPARSRPGWTWFVPVSLENEAGTPLAHPLPLRSFSVSLTARADGYVIMDERDEHWPAGTTVAVHRFIGSFR
ncbi:MAG: molybdopterin molybdotransferase MoeA [Candidatus Eremiobacteraeota bacterium]|nr:molybdopterin molybdotransferase MoeA [Candidatus Eremiobacteraeota bacterium]